MVRFAIPVSVICVVVLNYSYAGFGRHVQYPIGADLPILDIKTIVTTSRATVDVVQCRRIYLARKTMLCHRRFTPEEALEEVRHLQALNHRHIVRLVGSYAQGKYISILTYPVAEHDLKTFLAEAGKLEYSRNILEELAEGVSCLSATIRYIHASGIKHMDIKPQNILVQSGRRYPPHAFCPARFYITDFGISRFVQDLEASETDGFSQRTLMYCSPEVAAGLPHGRSSDIFSLGCVFAEIFTSVSRKSQAEFRCYRADDGETFHNNLPRVIGWIDDLSPHFTLELYRMSRYLGEGLGGLEPRDQTRPSKTVLKQMLQEEPKDRPTAADLVRDFPPWSCYSSEPEPL